MDVEKTMQFILDVQASQAVSIARQQEAVARQEAAIARQEAAIARHDELSEKNDETFDRIGQRMLELILFMEDYKRTQLEHRDELDELSRTTDRKFQETTEKLNALIQVVDGLVHRKQ
jgi:hypothetical protein